MLQQLRDVTAKCPFVVVSVVVLAFLLICYLPVRSLEGQIPTLYSDSAGYITFDPMRTAGYPAVIAMFQALRLGLGGVVLFQLVAFSLSIGHLWITLRRHFTPAVTSTISTLIVVNPFIIYHYAVLTESLTYSLLIVIICLCIDSVFGDLQLERLALISLCVGLATSLRPAAWGFALILPMLSLYFLRIRNWHNLFKWVAAGFAPLILVATVSAASAYLINGSENCSLADYVFYTKSILVSSGPAPAGLTPVETEVWTMAETPGTELRQLLDESPDGRIRAAVLYRIESPLMWDYVSSEVLPTVRQSISGPNAKSLTVLRKVGMRRLIANPGQFLRNTSSEYRILWTPFLERRSLQDVDGYLDRFMAASRSNNSAGRLPEDVMNRLQLVNSSTSRWRRFHIALRGLWLLLAAVGILLIVVPVIYLWSLWHSGNSDPLLLVASILGVTVHGCLVLDAVTGTCTTRFLVILIPAIVISISYISKDLFQRLRWVHDSQEDHEPNRYFQLG